MKSQLVYLKTAIAIAITISFLQPIDVTASDSNKIKNMSRLTCEEFLDMGTMQQIISVVWLSGWTSKERKQYMFAPDRSLLSNKKDLLAENCQNNQQDLVLKQVPDWEY